MSGLLAVGVPLGYTENATGQQGVIRHGRQMVLLDLADYSLWLRALQEVDADGLKSWAAVADITDAEESIADMLQQDFLLRLDDPRLLSAKRFRIQSSGIALGHIGEDRYGIGDHSHNVLVSCSGPLFSVWALSDGRALSDVIEQVATSSGANIRALGAHVVAELPVLIASGVASLDITPHPVEGGLE